MSERERAELLADLAERARYFATLTDVGLPRAAPTAAVTPAAAVTPPAAARPQPTRAEPARPEAARATGSGPANLPAPAASIPAVGASETLEAIRADIGDCQRCQLAAGRKTIVFGQGDPKARLMFVGEAPGADEDEQGLAFVGKAGQLLTKIIEAIGMRREDVFIANVLKCRPPGNRNPEPEEIIQCQPFLERQILSIRPEVLVGLGKFGAHWLLKTAEPITRLRGRLGQYQGIKVMPTYHPAYLLRNPGAKKEVWEDMKVVRDLLAR
jgi:uracil-DNA glycosylase family 4